MRSLGEFVKKQDAFGYAVTLNYKGEDMYKTMWGAILTLAQMTFILVVAVIGVMDLVAFKDPNITQYRIFDKRDDNTELSFSELHGGFFFAI